MFETTIRLHARPRRVSLAPPGSPWPPLALKPVSISEPRPEPAGGNSIEPLLARIHDALAQLARNRSEFLADWQASAVELACALTARVTHQQLEAGQFPMEEIVRDMLGSFPASSEVSVFLNPDDLRLLRDRIGARALLLDRDLSIRWLEDPGLGRGDCRIEDGEKVLLSQLAAQIRLIRDDMFRRLGHAIA